jgi:hypothetical protein
MKIFLRYFPKAKDHIDFVDLSTPLSIESWLTQHKGGAVGLDVTPARFTDPTVSQDCRGVLHVIYKL